MSDDLPTLPAELPTEIINTLNGYSLDSLLQVARYVKELAEYKAREARLEGEAGADEIDERPDDLPMTFR